jgi:hypothetical protein|tara:strand:- start:1486 stop:2028 length:543 start_codon:yes stop_codon:yes gene_type:complete
LSEKTAKDIKGLEKIIRSMAVVKHLEIYFKKTLQDIINGKLDGDDYYLEFTGEKKFTWEKRDRFWNVLWDSQSDYPYGQYLIDELEKDKIRLTEILYLETILNEANCSDLQVGGCEQGGDGWVLNESMKKQAIEKEGWIDCPACGDITNIFDLYNNFYNELFGHLNDIYVQVFDKWAKKQ